jgi:hypothetical protein
MQSLNTLLLLQRSMVVALLAVLFSVAATCQKASHISLLLTPSAEETVLAPNFRVADFRLETFPSDTPEPNPATEAAAGETTTDATAPGETTAGPNQQPGFLKGSAVRIAADQKRLYLAPLKPHNFKWDALVLVGAGAFLAADRHIENNVPNSHFHLYQDTSDIAIGGLAGSVAGVWLYGIKTEHRHARETGELALETLVNTFLVYTPMQLIFARQRPGEGNGEGDFFQHHSVNTSFPGGHAMFTWAMASVLADEYPKPWARALSYGAAFTVTFSRFMARDHWSSDMFVGTALGLGIAENTFHARCNPEYPSQCRHHQWRWKPMKTETQ